MSNKNKLGAVAIGMVKNIAEKVESVENKAEINIRNVQLSEIKLNPKNNFGMRDIEKLAESIKEHGQQHNAVIRVLHNDPDYSFEMISGERRYRAIQLNGGNSILSKIIDVDDLQAEALMIILNLETRVPNDKELSDNAARLVEIVKAQKKTGLYEGQRTNEVVAQMMTTETNKIDTAKVTKLVNVQKLIPAFKDLQEKGELSLEKANQLAQMPEEQQKMMYDFFQEGQNISAGQVKDLREQLKQEKETEIQSIMAQKAEEIKKARDEAQDFKKQADEAQGKLNKVEAENKILQDDLKKSQKTLEKLQKEQEKVKTELDNKIADIKSQLQEEVKKDLEEQNKETITKLQADLKEAQEQGQKVADDYKEKMDKLLSEHTQKEEQLKAKLQEQETIEANKAIQSLGRQAQKALNVLMEEISKAVSIPGFTLTEETKAIIAEISKFDGNV